MKKLIFIAFVILSSGILLITCQEAMSPDQGSQSSDIPNIETCYPPPPPPPCPPPEPLGCGRMTGGGSVFFGDDPRIRVTRGFELHCDQTLPNNLQVNWKGGNKFHLTGLTFTKCTENPDIHQFPPEAPFDTFEGRGVGRLNKVDGALIHFIFADHGEPGKQDQAMITIWEAGSDSTEGGDAPVLFVSGNIEVGNLQAHDDKCPE
jgi:hypothetical protein